MLPKAAHEVKAIIKRWDDRDGDPEPGWRLRSPSRPAIQVQPWPAGTGCPPANEILRGVMADPPYYFSFNLTARWQSPWPPASVFVFASPSTKIMLRPFFQHPRLGEQPRPAARRDERGAHVDGDHAQGPDEAVRAAVHSATSRRDMITPPWTVPMLLVRWGSIGSESRAVPRRASR